MPLCVCICRRCKREDCEKANIVQPEKEQMDLRFKHHHIEMRKD